MPQLGLSRTMAAHVRALLMTLSVTSGLDLMQPHLERKVDKLPLNVSQMWTNHLPRAQGCRNSLPCTSCLMQTSFDPFFWLSNLSVVLLVVMTRQHVCALCSEVVLLCWAHTVGRKWFPAIWTVGFVLSCCVFVLYCISAWMEEITKHNESEISYHTVFSVALGSCAILTMCLGHQPQLEACSFYDHIFLSPSIYHLLQS